MQLNRKKAGQLGREAVEIIRAGGYEIEGRRHDLTDAIERAIAGTCTYPSGAPLPEPPSPRFNTKVTVRNETTLAAAGRLESPMALNFASAKKPGGGFLGGARAQEESLARSSALYASIDGNAMYDFHRQLRDPMYSPYAIYSPQVPVFRDDDGRLIEPYLVSFITAPAPNAKVVLSRRPERAQEVKDQMRLRIARVLQISAGHGHTNLVLGAWGCGVFGNDLEDTALAFREALTGPFAGLFEQVVFAILDWSKERRFIEPFERLLTVPALGG